MFFREARALARPVLPTLLLLAALLTAAPRASAQLSGTDVSGTGGRHSINGRIISPSGLRTDLRLRIKLESTSHGDIWVFADANGQFRFQSLRPGAYTVVVEGGENFENVREPVFVDQSTIQTRRGPIGTPISRPQTVQIYLRPKRDPATADLASPGVLNAALAGVPKPAADLYQKATASMRKGENAKAIEQLRGALEFHPDFALALSALGVIYMKEKQPEKAAEVLRAAVKLVPDDYPTLLTYGRALFDRQQFAEAEEQFRKAAKKNSASPSAQFYLGLTALKRQDLDAAEKALQEAVRLGRDEIPVAHKYLGGIYWGRKDYQRAADELETYLRLAPDAEDASRLRATVKELRGKK